MKTITENSLAMQFTFIHKSLKIFKDRRNILKMCYIIMAETKQTKTVAEDTSNILIWNEYLLQHFPHPIYFQTTLYCYYKEGRNPPTLNDIDM